MRLDFARAHTSGIHGQDLVIKADEASLSFGDDLWLERAVAVPWGFKLIYPEIPLQVLATLSVPRVAYM
jgi:hypothetical protein